MDGQRQSTGLSRRRQPSSEWRIRSLWVRGHLPDRLRWLASLPWQYEDLALAGRAPTAHRPLHGYLEWLNLVELWFGELTNKFRRGTQQSVRALNHDIRAWIKTWNDGPYGWAKTSEQILDSSRVTARG